MSDGNAATLAALAQWLMDQYPGEFANKRLVTTWANRFSELRTEQKRALPAALQNCTDQERRVPSWATVMEYVNAETKRLETVRVAEQDPRTQLPSGETPMNEEQRERFKQICRDIASGKRWDADRETTA